MSEKDQIIKRPAYLELLSDDTVEECKKAMKLVRALRLSFNAPGEVKRMFQMSQEIIGTQAWLVGELMGAEQAYRIKMEAFRTAEWNKKGAVTTAEVAAKATPEYSAYKFLERVYELCTDQINLIKKFSDKADQEKFNLRY